MREIYGYIKHVKSGQFIKIEYPDNMYTLFCAVKDYYQATLITKRDALEIIDEDSSYKYAFKTTVGLSEVIEIDISEDEKTFVECEIILK